MDNIIYYDSVKFILLITYKKYVLRSNIINNYNNGNKTYSNTNWIY